jgi:transcriptional regulator of acetoin/glycerol metabolism
LGFGTGCVGTKNLARRGEVMVENLFIAINYTRIQKSNLRNNFFGHRSVAKLGAVFQGTAKADNIASDDWSSEHSRLHIN